MTARDVLLAMHRGARLVSIGPPWSKRDVVFLCPVPFNRSERLSFDLLDELTSNGWVEHEFQPYRKGLKDGRRAFGEYGLTSMGCRYLDLPTLEERKRVERRTVEA